MVGSECHTLAGAVPEKALLASLGCGNPTALAALKADDVAPAVIGRRIDALEERLGVKLLLRTTRRITLTHEGSAFLEDCQRLLADLANAEASVSAGGVKASGHLRITAPAGFGRRHVAPLMPGFLARHPLAPMSHGQGILACLHELQELLGEVTGMHAVSLAPASGAQGEFAGVAMIRAYHEARGDRGRTEILVPDAAHGTNPASAACTGPKRCASET